MAVRLKKGATRAGGQPVFNDVTQNRGLERDGVNLLTFSLSKNALNKINLPLDATDKSNHMLGTMGKAELLVGVIVLILD